MTRKMQNTAIPWIGSIPCEWKLIRIKNTSWLKGRIGWDGLQSKEFVDNGPYLITGTDFFNGKVNWSSCVHITKERYDEDELLHIKEGDLLITKDGTIGKLAIVENCPNEVSLNSGVMIIRNNSEFSYDNRYMYYVLSSDEFWLWFNINQKPNSTIQHLYQHQFGEFKFAYPLISEQMAIARYLDNKCDDINNSISRHQQIIEKLEEYRKSVITQAVTKGLNPDAEMIPVHQEWISNIPKGWQVLRLKFVMDNYDFQRRPVESSKRTQNSEILYDYYGATGIIDKIDGYTCEGKKILIGEDGANLLLRNIKLIYTPTGKYWVNNHTHILYPKGNNNIDYFAAQMECIDYTKYITGSAQPKLSQRNLNNVLLVVPPIDEQNEIAEFVNNKTSFINETIERHKNIMNKLQEYKQSLIYNAVTGKIDCRTTE